MSHAVSVPIKWRYYPSGVGVTGVFEGLGTISGGMVGVSGVGVGRFWVGVFEGGLCVGVAAGGIAEEVTVGGKTGIIGSHNPSPARMSVEFPMQFAN